MVSPNGKPTSSPPAPSERQIWPFVARMLHGLSPTQGWVLAALCVDVGESYHTNDSVAEMTGLVRGTVNRTLGELVKLGLIGRLGKKGRVVRYRVKIATNVSQRITLTTLSQTIKRSVTQDDKQVSQRITPCVTQDDTNGDLRGDGEGGQFPSPEREITPTPPPPPPLSPSPSPETKTKNTTTTTTPLPPPPSPAKAVVYKGVEYEAFDALNYLPKRGGGGEGWLNLLSKRGRIGEWLWWWLMWVFL